MAYLKGGSYVDGDLYVDGAIKVKSIATLGENATLSLYQGLESIKKHSLLKFAVNKTDPQAGAVAYSQIYVEENTSSHSLELTFGQPAEADDGWAPDVLDGIQEVKINHPVPYVKVGMTYHYREERPVRLILNPESRTWRYDIPNEN